MPDQPRNPDSGSRFEKLTKSVLETNHPLFGKIKKELPVLQRQSGRASSWKEHLLNLAVSHQLPQFAIIALCAIILSFFIYRQITDPYLAYKLGETAQRHLVAQKTVEVIDEETTETKRKVAMESVLSVYDYDRTLPTKIRTKIYQAFNQLRKNHQSLISLAERRAVDWDKSEEFSAAKKTFTQITGAEITDNQFEALVRLKFSNRLERLFIHLLAEFNHRYVVSNRELLKNEIGKGITLYQLDDDDRKTIERPFNDFGAVIDVETARAELEANSKTYFKALGNKQFVPQAERIISIVKRLIEPNLTLNRQETERRRRIALEEVKPVLMKVNKGESLVRYGETINKRHLTILQQMEQQSQNDNSRFQFFFTAVFLSLVIYSLVAFLSGGMKPFPFQWQDIGAIVFLMVTTITGLKGVQFLVTEALIDKFPQVPFDFYFYLVPISMGPVIVRMLMGKLPALIYTVVLAVVGGILLERNFFYAAYILATSLLACSFATSIKTRGVIYRAGLITGALSVVMIISIVANTRNAASLNMLWNDINWILVAGFCSGLFMSMVVVAMVPLIEWISGRTSDLRLLELANMNHPLLRDLMVKAPGTYHHCIVIGSLVEAAAEAIGANPLLSRVMAYYHDVGKMERPLYFIENQGGGYNRHDGLQPHMSAMIIREHVKRGQELGRKFKLPQPLIDAMSEHHGSSTIWYFYNKARSQAEDPESVLESDYKYDGSKPQSKETALVMLGDVVEAATRSVADPTPLRLSGVVKNILNKYFAEGQLSECDLTLRDLDLIAKSFLDVLLGIYHARIEYGVSSIRDSAKKKHGGSDTKNGARVSPGGGMAGAQGAAPYTKPFPVPGSGGGGSKKG